jgi:hypothetical protein
MLVLLGKLLTYARHPESATARCLSGISRPNSMLHTGMEWIAEFRNEVLTDGIQALPEDERRLIVDVFGNEITTWQYCKTHRITRDRFGELQASALSMLNSWLIQRNVRDLRQIL